MTEKNGVPDIGRAESGTPIGGGEEDTRRELTGKAWRTVMHEDRKRGVTLKQGEKQSRIMTK